MTDYPTGDGTSASHPDGLPEYVYNREAEAGEYLAKDETLLGRMYRYEQDGLSPAEIAELEGNNNQGFVSSYKTQLRAIVSGEIPTSPTIALQTASRVRTILKSSDITDWFRNDLVSLEAQLVLKGEDYQAKAVEEDGAVAASKKEELNGVSGIYVYTLPHYLRYPYDPESGKTLFKVGHSSKDAFYRASSQGRLTALPEDPILLRVYPTDDDSGGVEKDFHAWLMAAGHIRSRSTRGGSEWFVTSLKFLDRIAQSKSLGVHIINEFETVSEGL